ncbi:hypothetical protein AB0J48_18015 [Nocardia salmonicida]|uniref:hypothetical protein n=1 Tax=Nocardia salmonicida TaxID=53431 RepID=UPI0034185F82
MVNVLAGRLVVDDLGGVSWFALRTPALPAAQLRVDPGISLAVDPVSPADPLGWSIDPGADPAALGEVFSDPALVSLVAMSRADGPSIARCDCPTLPPTWAHRAHVAATARWTLRPLDNGALLLDEAMAESRCGRLALARRLFGYGEYALLALGEQAVDGELSSAATELVRAAMVAAVATGLGGEIADLAEQLIGVEEAHLSAALADWRAVDESVLVGAGTYAHDRAAPESDTAYVMADPTVLPPRILAWPGAARPEIRVDYRAGAYELRSRLAAGVDPWCAEATELLAYTVDETTGRLLGVAPVEAGPNGDLFAELPDRGEPGARAFGLFSAEIDPEQLRGTAFGRTGIEVDRELLEGWNFDRAAATRRHLTGDSPELTELVIAAETAVGNARALVDDLLLDDHPDAVARTLQARLEAIDAYLAVLVDAEPRQGAVLLCELIEPSEDW